MSRRCFASLLLALTMTACGGEGITVAPNIPDRPLMLRTGAPPTTKAHVAVFEGRPPYAYDALAFVRTCSFFVASRDALLEQAASVGADAIIEPAWNGENGQCLCGIAVRYRR
jgi:hypothetical protein